jgi:rare lipoprotein A
VIVRLNDRGPFVDDRIIDLSKKAGATLGMQAKGTARVRVQYVGPAPAAPNAVPAQQIVAAPIAAEAPLAPPQVATQPASEPAPILTSQPLAPIVQAQPVRSEAARADAGRGYFLQAGSFADLGNAHALRTRLSGFGPVSVVSVDVNGSEFYRVMVGPWASRPEAESAQGRLVDNGAKALIVAKLD